jgi:hypothetical protein
MKKKPAANEEGGSFTKFSCFVNLLISSSRHPMAGFNLILELVVSKRIY